MNLENEIDTDALDLFNAKGFEWQETGRTGFRPMGFTDQMVEQNYRSGVYVVVDLPYLQDSGLAAAESKAIPLSARDPHVKRKQLARLGDLLQKIKTDMVA